VLNLNLYAIFCRYRKNDKHCVSNTNIYYLNNNISYRPEFYRLDSDVSIAAFRAMIDARQPQKFDTIQSQLFELMLCRNPSKTKAEVKAEKKVEEHLKHSLIEPESYGVWVYFAWKNQLVHILDEEEFIEVRTNRNKYKITQEEQDILRTKKVGIVGLSVGRAVATTMALERIAGEIRLADFDEVELSNLNRILAPLTEMGVNKTIVTAREIAELDPFIKVKCYTEGLQESNMDSFFTDDGKLDLLVEECDGLGIKVIVRQKAKELLIPVIMETNDRCMIDIERFDLEPNRELLHGLVKGLNVETLKNLKTNEEKMPYILSLIDIDKTSISMRASMLEIDQSVVSWPQLGSSVIAGGAIAAHYSKGILLNKSTESGRTYNDFEKLDFENSTSDHKAPLECDYKKIYNSISCAEKQEEVDSNHLVKIIEAGLQAPSAGNNQPWQYIYKNGTLYLYHNMSRSRNHWDKMHMTAGIALGCSIKNIELTARDLGYRLETTTSYDNLSTYNQPIATFRFITDTVIGSSLSDQIFRRSTMRLNVKSEEITASELEKLKISCKDTGVRVNYYTERNEINSLGKLLGKAEQIRLMNEQGHKDFVREVRWTPEEAEAKKDGVDLATFNLKESEKAALNILKEPKVIKVLKDWDRGSGIVKMITDSTAECGGIGILWGHTSDYSTYINAGMSFQLIWLQAVELGIHIHPYASLSVLLNEFNNDINKLSDSEIVAVSILKLELELLVEEQKESPLLFFRLNKNRIEQIKSYRLQPELSFIG
jgi:molybdopterin/thiamine biosynthesis adenylyltransferase